MLCIQSMWGELCIFHVEISMCLQVCPLYYSDFAAVSCVHSLILNFSKFVCTEYSKIFMYAFSGTRPQSCTKSRNINRTLHELSIELTHSTGLFTELKSCKSLDIHCTNAFDTLNSVRLDVGIFCISKSRGRMMI